MLNLGLPEQTSISFNLRSNSWGGTGQCNTKRERSRGETYPGKRRNDPREGSGSSDASFAQRIAKIAASEAL